MERVKDLPKGVIIGAAAIGSLAAGYLIYKKLSSPSQPYLPVEYKPADLLDFGAGSSENHKTLGALSFDDCECRYGFKRPDFKDGELIGTAEPHNKHVVICTGTCDWPAEPTEFGNGLVTTWSNGLKRARKEIGKVKLTLCDMPSKGAGHDILIFPDMIRYNGIKQDQIQDVIDRHFIKGEICENIENEKMRDVWVMVCSHTSRDMRCGVCGPQLVKAFQEALATPEFAQMQKRITILRTTHIGGHKYAGNIVVYKKHSNGQYVGDWYGYVQPSDVPTILHEDIGKGKIVKSLWRGRGNLTKELQKKLLQLV